MQSQQLITWGVPLVLLLIALLLVVPLVRQHLERRRLEKRIGSVGVEQLKNVLLDDGMGGQSFFERLLLTPNGILVLISNYRDGIIFGGERMDMWAQVLGKRTIRFTNPLHYIDAQLSTLRFHLPKVMVKGSVLFMGDCRFPKGKPERVWTLRELDEVVSAEHSEPVAPQHKQAWEEIGQRAREIDPASDGYLLPMNGGVSRVRIGLALFLIVLVPAWMLWRLL